ncbi:hypothetical protein OJ252_122 [Cryptosporidium canis]|uniref:Uncharacterized protein n=1 Tax=Cryptosporidium canis TaxID=195482 RepID=A0ABQ8PCD5_9CRYT|nr:hypothetical protein OJ252_122 [Cryptosporidium canis]
MGEMRSEQFDNTDLGASNMSELSYGASLCLSTKDQYKVINRNQLTKLDFQLFRAGTTSIECGMSLMEEISDLEDDYESPFERRSKRERVRQFVEDVKHKSKRGCSSLMKSISNIGRRMRMKIASVRSARGEKGESSDNLCHKSFPSFTSSCSNFGKSNSCLSLSKLKSMSRNRVISTSRRARLQRKVSQASDRATYKLKTNLSYISKRFVSASSSMKSRIVYNCYKLRNMIGDKFPRRSSMFVLSFRKGSEDVERKTMNCGHNLSNDMSGFENELIYDSIEYISRNDDEAIEELESGNYLLMDSPELESESRVAGETSQVEDLLSEQENMEAETSSNVNPIEISLIKNELSRLESNNESDEVTPTTTIDSFLRLSSVDSTTCTTIQNDTNSNTPLPVMQCVGKAMEQVESLYQELIQLKSKAEGDASVSESQDDKGSRGFEPFEKEDMEIFSLMKEIVDDMTKDKEEISSGLGTSNDSTRQSQFRSELIFTLLRQTIQYYENIKSSYVDFDLKKAKSADNEQVRHLIVSAAQRLRSGGNMHAL